MKLREMEDFLGGPVSIELTPDRKTAAAGLAPSGSGLAAQYKSFAKLVAGEERTGGAQQRGHGLRGLLGMLKRSPAAVAAARR